MMTRKHKVRAKELEKEIEKALSFYPELADYGIIFRFRTIDRQSYMLAQPRFRTLLFPRKFRQYKIIMNKKYFTQNPKFEGGKVDFDILVGWIGHELGHVMDYKDMSTVSLMWFGYKYAYRDEFVRIAEIAADKYAVHAGLIDYLVVSKEHGRDPNHFKQSYIDKLNDLYPSVATVKEWDRLHKLRLEEHENINALDPNENDGKLG